MEFCSKYGYDYGFDGSDSDEYEEEGRYSRDLIHKSIRKADVNIIAAKFDQLVKPNEMFAGEPKKCKTCTAVMSHLSAANIKNENEKKTWTCEFCNEENDVTTILDDINELPTKDDVTFLIDVPATIKEEEPKAELNNISSDNKYMTFALDISGSMNTPIPFEDETSHSLIRNGHKVSRLEGVKIACMETLKNLKESEPEKRVSLVTFCNSVMYYGDCTKAQPTNIQIDSSNTLQGTKIEEEKRRIIEQADALEGDLKAIKESHPFLQQKISDLRTGGCTALGPALAYSIAFSSKLPGSSVILCTDGCANVGIGSVERNPDEPSKFYDEIADYAKSKGVTVNVISMQGTDCNLAILGRVADRSNGSLSIVNPLNLSAEFSSILQSRVVATNVEAKLIVNHKYLYIRDEKLETEEAAAIDKGDKTLKEELTANRKSISTQSIGNANIDTEITFEFGVRKLNDAAEKEKSLDKLPFQLQILYTAQDGSKALRVYTKIQEFTKNRAQAERSIISDLFMINAQQKNFKVRFGFEGKCGKV